MAQARLKQQQYLKVEQTEVLSESKINIYKFFDAVFFCVLISGMDKPFRLFSLREGVEYIKFLTRIRRTIQTVIPIADAMVP